MESLLSERTVSPLKICGKCDKAGLTLVDEKLNIMQGDYIEVWTVDKVYECTFCGEETDVQCVHTVDSTQA